MLIIFKKCNTKVFKVLFNHVFMLCNTYTQIISKKVNLTYSRRFSQIRTIKIKMEKDIWDLGKVRKESSFFGQKMEIEEW